MTALLRVEWRRMWSRRLPWIITIIVAGVMAFAGVSTFVTSDPTPPTVADQAEQIERDVAMCREGSIQEWDAWNAGDPFITGDPGYDEWMAQFDSGEALADENCNPAYFGYYVEDPRFCLVSLYEPDVQWRQACPDLEDVENSEWSPGQIEIDGVIHLTPHPPATGAVPSAALGLLGVAAVLGASFIGAEYSAGTIETLLLWEPRRRRVLSAKVVVAAVVAFVLLIGLLAFLTAVLVPAGVWRGSTAGADAAFWRGLGGVIARTGLAGAGVAAIALSISAIARHTVAGVVAFLGYIALSPALVNTILRGFRPFDLTENLGAFIGGGEVGRWVSYNGYYEQVVAHGVLGAGFVILGYVAVFVAAGLFVFNRRDVD
ncbi:MAG: ABC transporter permease subunit [Acidimicrobiia bacterium]|nr:ABC transporter permease subunit [Acidimicrobiia bacterium]